MLKVCCPGCEVCQANRVPKGGSRCILCPLPHPAEIPTKLLYQWRNCSGSAASSRPNIQVSETVSCMFQNYVAKQARANRITPGCVREQLHHNTVMLICVWAPAIICSVGLEAEEALSMASLDWPPLVAKWSEEGGA